MPPVFQFQVLGANSATPLPSRYPSSFILNYQETLILIDCGEGAQMKMSEFAIKRSRINYIFISHLHGDHIFGLPGFINSLNLNGRKAALMIYGPVGLKEYIDTIHKLSEAHLNFPVIINEIRFQGYQKLAQLPGLEVYSFPLKHRIPTFGYLFSEIKRELNIRSEAIDEFKLSIEEIRELKKGRIPRRNSVALPVNEILKPPIEKRKFAYCSDTVFDPGIIPFITGANLLYHEATYLQDMQKKAQDRMHSTAKEAATIALRARVKKLIIGHYSSRYRELSGLLEEAQEVFPLTELGIEGSCFDIV